MTHPPGQPGGGSGSSGGGTGPGRTAPLSEAQRADNYRRQTGRTALSPRQRRRIAHKANRSMAHHPGPQPVPTPQPTVPKPPPPYHP